MSVPRACLPCRTAKAKCSLARPTCDRCRQRGLFCYGFPPDDDFIFRSENEVAQRNSERARRESRGRSAFTASLDVTNYPEFQEPQTQASTEIADAGLQQQYSWLNERALAKVPGPLKRDLESRAVDRFFINWTLHPWNNGVSPGHMHDLPTLYLSAPPESVLWLAVRAMAFADMRGSQIGDISFPIKARRNYGAALNRMRAIANDNSEHVLAQDRVLAAVILIDTFELMYLAWAEPLGPHTDALKYILHTRGDKQFYNRANFALWRVAHQRLQARQVLLREEPDVDQKAWMGKLNTNLPDNHISVDVMRMSILNATAKQLTQNSEDTEATLAEKIEKARQLVHCIRDLIASIENWTSDMTGVWKPKEADPQSITQLSEMDGPPIPQFPCPHMLSFHDIWLAYMWNFHAASQIVLRESLVDVISYQATLQQHEPDLEDMESIQGEQAAIERIGAAIIRSFPPLLGFIHRRSQEPNSLPQGKMVGRFFSIFSLWVVQKAKFTSLQHKLTASEVIAWIKSRHGLD